MDEEESVLVSIPRRLSKRIENRIKGTSFASVSSYVTYVLERTLSETDAQEQAQALSKEDEERVKERLRVLGYLH